MVFSSEMSRDIIERYMNSFHVRLISKISHCSEFNDGDKNRNFFMYAMSLIEVLPVSRFSFLFSPP